MSILNNTSLRRRKKSREQEKILKFLGEYETDQKNFRTFKEVEGLKNINSKEKAKPIVKKLVLAGGGLRGLAYIGAISALRKLRILENVETVLGCSIGAIFALLIVLNFSDEELYDFLLHFHYDQLKDLNFFKIMSEWGLESGSKIETFLLNLIKRKTGLFDPTFAELYQKTNISLIVNAVALDEFELYFFGNSETPNMKVVKAIRASISVPGLFIPVRYDSHIFVDGALLNNFPIDYFSQDINDLSILGICFDQVVKPPGITGLTGINSYIYSVMGCVMNKMVKLRESKINYKTKIIAIHTGEISAFQSVLDRTKRLYLFHHGEKAVYEAYSTSNLKFIKKHSGPILRRNSI